MYTNEKKKSSKGYPYIVPILFAGHIQTLVILVQQIGSSFTQPQTMIIAVAVK